MAPDAEAEEFLYIVTHDLKAFARAMRVIPEWIEEDIVAEGHALPPDVLKNIAMLRDYAGRMDATLDALTRLSRVSRLADPYADHDLHRLVTEEIGKLHTPQGFGFVVECNALRVHGPENDLRSLFATLLENALVHHDRARGTISVAAQQHKGRVSISIRDDGPGIPERQRDAVFKPLATLQPKSETGRAGVGLAIARKAILSLGGDITITSGENGRGCCCIFDLPAGDKAG